VTISEAAHADRDAVIALWQEAGLTRPWNDPASDFGLALDGATSTILLAWDAGQLVGSVMAGFDGHRGWVYYLASGLGHRGSGIGRRLMKAAEDWLRELGAPKIQLMVRTDNDAARGFYETIGYEVQQTTTLGRWLD